MITYKQYTFLESGREMIDLTRITILDFIIFFCYYFMSYLIKFCEKKDSTPCNK